MAFGNASAERAAIELTYEDTATVSRTTSQRGKNNISTSSPSVIYDDCVTRKDQKVRTGENDSVIIDVVLCVRLSAIV